jgi:hypothetical protein
LLTDPSRWIDVVLAAVAVGAVVFMLWAVFG